MNTLDDVLAELAQHGWPRLTTEIDKTWTCAITLPAKFIHHNKEIQAYKGHPTALYAAQECLSRVHETVVAAGELKRLGEGK